MENNEAADLRARWELGAVSARGTAGLHSWARAREAVVNTTGVGMANASLIFIGNLASIVASANRRGGGDHPATSRGEWGHRRVPRKRKNPTLPRAVAAS